MILDPTTVEYIQYLEHADRVYERMGGMKKLRGRNPNASERKIMTTHGIDPNHWLINKVKMIATSSESGDTAVTISNVKGRLSKYQEKVQQWTFVHRENGETKTIQVEGNW